MNLTHAQRRLLQQGDCTSLLFPYDPDDKHHGQPVQGECCVVLRWEEKRRVADQHGNVTVVPPRPVHWIEVTSIKRHRKGDWQVRFDDRDFREHPRFLAAGGGYTSSRFRAIDDAEVVPSAFQEGVSKRAYDRDRAMRLEQVAARQQERWRFKRERRRAAARLSDAA